jgi:hypothetical protein
VYRDNASGLHQSSTPQAKEKIGHTPFQVSWSSLAFTLLYSSRSLVTGPAAHSDFSIAAPSVNSNTLPPTGRPKQRNSILVAASDALSFSLRRSKRATIQHAITQKQRHPVVDEVLEISAEAAQKDGVAERERLRDAAAQAVGLAGTTPSDPTTLSANLGTMYRSCHQPRGVRSAPPSCQYPNHRVNLARICRRFPRTLPLSIRCSLLFSILQLFSNTTRRNLPS